LGNVRILGREKTAGKKRKEKITRVADYSDAGSRTQSSAAKYVRFSDNSACGVHRAPRPTYSFVLVVGLVGDIIQREHEFGAGPNELERSS
jgi:hypothetical protein